MVPLTCTLTSKANSWRVPAYAGDMLWIEYGDERVPVSGPYGTFTLELVSGENELRLAWGAPGGPLLAGWPLPDDVNELSLRWDGSVLLAGFVERLHVLEAHGLELVIAEIEGAPLPHDYPRLPTLDLLRAAPFSRRTVRDAPTGRDGTYTVIASADSIHADYLHHAMVSELSIDCSATLGPQDGGWHTLVGLPLLVEGLALLAPGYRGRLG